MNKTLFKMIAMFAFIPFIAILIWGFSLLGSSKAQAETRLPGLSAKSWEVNSIYIDRIVDNEAGKVCYLIRGADGMQLTGLSLSCINIK